MERSFGLLVLVWTLLAAFAISMATDLEVDKKGYIMYCPCMGRFGNQADHFLGSLSFAHKLDRTLVLPGWIEYPEHSPGNSFTIPFDKYFNVESLKAYHKVITMEKFMESLADKVWPVDQRTVFCYSGRMGPTKNDCNAKDGNPFGPFWDNHGIDFVKSEFYGEIGYRLQSPESVRAWHKRYPPSEYPVIAFTGAPAAFPVTIHDAKLHKYLVWSNYIQRLAKEFIRKNIPVDGKFVGIHLRNGRDWKNACVHVNGMNNLMASTQCLGENNEFGKLTREMCFPPKKTVLSQTRHALKNLRAKTLFVAADHDHMIEDFKKYLKNMKHEVTVVQRIPSEPHVDLAILAQADHFIGNCVSSFTAFAKRERDANSLKSSFWAFHHKRSKVEL